jgi:hypothetical protein
MIEDTGLSPIRDQVVDHLQTWKKTSQRQKLEAHDNLTLMIMYYNSWVVEDVAEKTVILEILNGRGWYAYHPTLRCNPSWMRREDYERQLLYLSLSKKA